MVEEMARLSMATRRELKDARAHQIPARGSAFTTRRYIRRWRCCRKRPIASAVSGIDRLLRPEPSHRNAL